jgi:hypothetical protein
VSRWYIRRSIAFGGVVVSLGRLMINFHHWSRPLHTLHHEQPDGRPRAGRRFDWYHCLGNGVGPVHILWLYDRAPDGSARGRTIEWCWRPKAWFERRA